jgi:hypothetical protein
MISCKDVATSVDSGQLETAPWWTFFSVYIHLAMCRPCRAFRRYSMKMNEEVTHLGGSFATEPGPDFDERLRGTLRMRI